jgi:ABC-type amino acid transport system permease subunit
LQQGFKIHLKEFKSREFELLVGLAIITIIEALIYGWIEVLLYSSDNPVLYDTWILGHYTTYHLALATLVIVMMFGVGFVAYILYSPKRLWRFFLLALGNFGLWLVLEDEFTFIFSGARHTPTDWTNWPIGAIDVFGNYIPGWYILMFIAVFVVWYFGLSIPSD